VQCISIDSSAKGLVFIREVNSQVSMGQSRVLIKNKFGLSTCLLWSCMWSCRLMLTAHPA